MNTQSDSLNISSLLLFIKNAFIQIKYIGTIKNHNIFRHLDFIISLTIFIFTA
jgi:hypothetical protein